MVDHLLKKIFIFNYFNCLKYSTAHCYKDRCQRYNGGSVKMLKGSSLKSPNGKYRLTLQYDGNFVLYCGFKAIWSIEKNAKDVEAMHFESDGNLVVRKTDYSVIWQSGAKGSKATVLYVQDDGNVVIRDDDGNAIWDTKTYDKCGKPGNFLWIFWIVCFSIFLFLSFFPLHFFWEDLTVANTNFVSKRFKSISIQQSFLL